MPVETHNGLEHHSYSDMYKLLVHGKDNLAGQFAYAIYK